ncbi:olfactory receptor 6B1-like [Myripristis murdjan]|uniref:Olfactory receptor n=1 Tax=Myripristis murdjan TaxID=586833 RepID=A0A667X891_9TELE|nr:olfactory receptor 6B1-like [Myripristis murdjan]
MENTTQIVSFVLAAYGNIGHLKYLYFIIILLWYLLIFVANSVLIVVIFRDRRLHQPMYIFLCSLFVNEIFGSTSMYPCLLSQMFSDTHEVSVTNCFLQILFLYTSVSVEYCNLAAMAYDRYISICYPLHYSVIMTSGRVCTIILLVWVYSFVKLAFTFSLPFHFTFCGNIIDKVFCDLQLVSNLACSVSTFHSVLDLLFGIITIALPLIPISFSYLKILIVCLQTSREAKRKAICTCTPQIVSLLNLCCGCFFDMFQSRSNVAHIPSTLRVVLSVYLLICQPVLSPIMYGLTLSKIRNACKRFLLNRK